MRYLLHAQLIAVLAAGTAAAQETASPPRDVGCIVRIALDYLEGGLTADAGRVARSADAGLIPLRVLALRDGQTGLSRDPSPISLRPATDPRIPESPVEVVVFDGGPVFASARAATRDGVYLLQFAKLDGKWRIVSVLWSGTDAAHDSAARPSDAEDSAAVAVALRDYLEARALGDRQRAGRAVHPDAIGISFTHDPATGRGALDWSDSRELLEPAHPTPGAAAEPPSSAGVTVFDVSSGMAAARVTTAREVEHLQLARLGGRWQIVAVLRGPREEPTGTVS